MVPVGNHRDSLGFEADSFDPLSLPAASTSRCESSASTADRWSRAGTSPAASPNTGSEGSHMDATRDMRREKSTVLRWSYSDEEFEIGAGTQVDFTEHLPILKDRLFLSSMKSSPSAQPLEYYLSLNRKLRYVPFCADFGPFNLGTTHHVCTILKNLLKNPDFANTKIIYYCFVESSDITNAIYLLGAFLCIYMGATPEQAWLPFRKLNSSLSLPYRDATWVKSTYDLHLTDCWAGIRRALDSNIYRPETFDKNEYLYYDDPNNGDLHEVMAGKFIAFKGPRAKRIELVNGSFTMLPSDYVEVFRAKNVTCVVRLNNPEYDKRDFEDAGFTHHDLFFTDCSTPPDELVDRFLHIAEGASGIVAVHCLAGLGRTGTLIGLYMMKHNGFTAREVMAWLRISRPGSIIGPQQHYLEEQEERMRQLGRQGVAGLGGAIRRSPVSSGRNSPKSLADRESSVAAKQKANGKSAVLADMVTDGMMNRDRARLQAFTKTAAQATPSHKSRLNSELRRTSSALDMGNPANTEAEPAGAASDGDKLPAINKGASKATSAVSGGREAGAPRPAQAAKSGAAAKPAGFAARIKSLAGGTFKEKPSLAKKEAAKTDGGTSGLSNLVRTGTY